MSNDKDFKVKKGVKPTVYHEKLGTVVSGTLGYNLNGASYDSVSFSVGSQDTSPAGLFFKPDGLKMYVVGLTGQDINEYNLGTAWNISTASYVQNFSVAAQESQPVGVFFKPDGTKMYVLGLFGDDVNEYSLSTPWNISTASYVQVFSVASQDTAPMGIFFKPDGLKMYITGGTGQDVNEYSLSTAWNISTASYVQVFSVASQDTNPRAIFFKPDGTRMYVVGQTGDDINEYSLSTPWNISTASYVQIFSIASQETNPIGLFFKDDGTKMYVVGVDNDTVYQYSTTLNTRTLDLSTGSVFQLTPSSNIQLNLSNPADSGTVSGATLLLEGADPSSIGSIFSTSLYTGNGSTQTINNGIDLAGEGGLVWIKSRSAATDNFLFDTVRGTTKEINSNSAAAEATLANSLTAFNANGFSVGSATGINVNAATYASWTFLQAPRFFDVVSFTTDASGAATFNHNLSVTPGAVFIKRTGALEQWYVWHRGLTATSTQRYLGLNTTAAETNVGFNWISVSDATCAINGLFATSTNYVAYLFAHDPLGSSGSNGRIACGSYTGTGSTLDVSIGFEPQWVLIKNATGSGYSWYIYDTVRGIPTGGNDSYLLAESNGAEAVSGDLEVTSTGIRVTASFNTNYPGNTYIYMAIRSPSEATITYDPSVDFPGGTAPTSPAIGDTDVLVFTTRDGGTSYKASLAIDGAK